MSDEHTVPGPSQDSASLLRRLAGASIMKAGLSKDQTEINRIIAEASKGSKFYENEKRKDKELTEKINRILKQRDEVMKGADIDKIERNVDAILAKMEAQRDLTQIIVHVDMDAFYASVELLENPGLEGKPFAVGHGVISTASYEARKHGVRSGMPEFIAKKLCKDLIVIRLHFSRYTEMSNKVMSIFRRYDPNMCVGGCDEGYLNITKYCEENLITAEECIMEMRSIVHKETKLTASAGIAPNKMLAKICSDKNKPNGQFMLEFKPASIKAFMHDLPLRKIPGVGKVNERLLDSIGIKTCGDIYAHRAAISLMDKQFGLNFLLQVHLGIASNVVQPGIREETKSIGSERTFETIHTKEDILKKLEEVAEELADDMERSRWTGKTVTLKYKLDTYQVFTRAKSFDKWISTKKEDLFAVGKALVLSELPLRLRLIGLRVTKLKDLKLNDDDKPGGIKRFFEKANDSSSASDKATACLEPSEVEEPTLSQDGYEVSMPGFNNEDDMEEITAQAGDAPELQEQDVAESSKARRRPPVSAPALASVSQSEPDVQHVKSISPAVPLAKQRPSVIQSTSEPLMLSSSKKRKRSSTLLDVRSDSRNSETCPICEKILQTDNRGLNEHIDFCLSKSAIKEAQAQTCSSVTGQGTSKGKSVVRKRTQTTSKPIQAKRH